VKDYYYILGVLENATQKDIKKAYRKSSLKFHPDYNKGEKYFEDRFKDINEAYENLGNNAKRNIYDAERKRNRNNGNSSDRKASDMEKDIKKKYEDILKKKEEEIKRKYWTKEQIEQEEEDIRIKKERIEKEKITVILKKELTDLLVQRNEVEIELKNIKLRIIELNKLHDKIDAREIEIRNKLNPLDNSNNKNSKEDINYIFNLDHENEILLSLNMILMEIPNSKVELFFSNLLQFCSEKTMSFSFVSSERELADYIRNSKYNNSIFINIYQKIGKQKNKKIDFTKQLFEYIKFHI